MRFASTVIRLGALLALATALCAAPRPGLAAETGSAADGPVSPLNGRRLEQPEPGTGYSIWLVGHSYGKTVFPVASLLVNVREINAAGARALFLLGDTVQLLSSVHLRNLRLAAEQFDMPVFLAAGNHETLEYESYVREFGNPWYELRIGHELYLILYLNMDHDAVSPSQIRWLKGRAEAALRDPEIRNVVILNHHMVWSVDDPRLEIVRSRLIWPPDYRSGFFNEVIRPIIDIVAERKPVYWISGDRVSFPPLYWRDPERNVTYLATGLKDHPADSIIELRAEPSGRIGFRLVSLAGLELGPIEQYTPEFWEAYYVGESRVVNVHQALPLQLLEFADEWMFISNRRFIYGAGFAATVTAAFFLTLMGLLRWHRGRRRRLS